MYGLFAVFFLFFSFALPQRTCLISLRQCAIKIVHRIDWFEQRLKQRAIRMCSACAVASCIQRWHITQLKLFVLLLPLPWFELHEEAIENNRTKETMVKWNEDDLLVFRILIDERNERMNEIATTTTRSAHFVFVCIHVYRIWSRARASSLSFMGMDATFQCRMCISFIRASVSSPMHRTMCDRASAYWCCCRRRCCRCFWCCIRLTNIYIDIYIFSHVTLKLKKKTRIQTESMIYPWPWPCYQEHRRLLSKIKTLNTFRKRFIAITQNFKFEREKKLFVLWRKFLLSFTSREKIWISCLIKKSWNKSLNYVLPFN